MIFLLGVISVLIVGEIFFLSVEDDDHLSSGPTETEQVETGFISTGSLSS